MYVGGMRTENDISFGAEKARDSSREREGAFLACDGRVPKKKKRLVMGAAMLHALYCIVRIRCNFLARIYFLLMNHVGKHALIKPYDFTFIKTLQ